MYNPDSCEKGRIPIVNALAKCSTIVRPRHTSITKKSYEKYMPYKNTE